MCRSNFYRRLIARIDFLKLKNIENRHEIFYSKVLRLLIIRKSMPSTARTRTSCTNYLQFTKGLKQSRGWFLVAFNTEVVNKINFY